MTAKIKNELSPTPLHYLVYLLQQLSEELLAEAGVSLSHVRILGVLDGKVPSSQAEVAVNLHQTEANVSRQLQAMHKIGMVKISKNKKDGRQRDVTISAKGKRKYQQAENLLKKQQSKFLTKNELSTIEKLAHKL
jgi:DNA-binding MarR family transcriptional regulator